MEEKNTYQKIYDVVRQIPRGSVATYGQVAFLAGNARWARVVGYALHVNPDPEGIPCYRVVTKEGKVSQAFAFGGFQPSGGAFGSRWDRICRWACGYGEVSVVCRAGA